MVYRILYYLVNILIRVFYRKLYVNGLENIDPAKTYLITSNHPNGFFEPLIMACTFPIDLYFMVRGDMFENPIMNWFLRSTHQIPIYRFTDGFANMKKNQASMEEAINNLNDGHSILVFAEGSTKALMKCRPIQKGTAKMAFQTFDTFPNKEIYILPVGINFNDWRNPGNEVIVNIGKPFKANTYYNQEKAVGIRQLTQRIEVEMKELILEVDQKHENMVRKFWSLVNLQQKAWPRKDDDPSLYQKLKTFTQNISDDSVVIEVQSLYEEISLASKKYPKGIKGGWEKLLSIIGIPGLIFHFVPVYLGYWMRDNKVKRDAFAAPVLGITSFALTVLLYLVTLIAGGIFFNPIYVILFLAGMAVSGFCFLLYWESNFKLTTKEWTKSHAQKLDSIIKRLA